MSFARTHGLHGDAAQAMVADIAHRLRSGDLTRLRLAWADQHGLVRGKTLMGERAIDALENGVGFVGTNLLKDTSDRTAWPVFTAGGGFADPALNDALGGAADVLLIPDPLTFHELPWSAGTGWVQCQAYFADGRLAPFDTRGLLNQVLAQCLDQGQQFRVGLEVECHLYRITDERLDPDATSWPAQPPEVALLAPGYRLLTEQRYDRIEPVIELLREPLQALGLPLESVEIELGPSQVEFVFAAQNALAAADAMLLFRHATKQIMRRHGLLATFMCKPALPEAMASGWHLHQSLIGPDQRNLFAADSGDHLSQTGQWYLGGLLHNAAAATALGTPTINGYRRYRPNMLAPDRINWGLDNRGALLRVIGAGDARRIENRGGEPAANPYLYLASQLACGRDGINNMRDPGPPVDAPYSEENPLLPRSLGEALTHLQSNTALRDALGVPFIDYYCQLKRAELARFEQQVTEWEQREYFELF